MEISINSYNHETDEQRAIRLFSEQVKTQEKLIKKQEEIIEIQKKMIQTRDEQREGFISLVAELVKEIDEWRTKAGQKKLSEEYFEACAKDPDPEATVIKMKQS